MSDPEGLQNQSIPYRYRYHFFFGMLVILSVINLGIDIMDVDAAQYASISMEMAQTQNYLQLYHRGADYLDKPPLLFWLSSLSISFFGPSGFAYKLPAVLILWFGVWATYKFGSLWYNQRTGMISAFVLASTQAFHLMTNDIRTDGLLTSFVIGSVYWISVFLKRGHIFSLLAGGICIGAAMLTKGPIGIIIPGAAIGGHLIMSRQWKKIVDWKWLLLLPVIGLVLSPMLYGLYQQFDLHPEKEVYGLKGPSGIGFYFWTQSFGRITGDNYWQNDTPVFYFLQTILWDLQPWVLLFFAALGLKIKNAFKRNKFAEESQEWITFFGFIIPLIALSFSQYKLPHYIFPLFPFAAVLIAHYADNYVEQIPKWFRVVHFSLLHLLVIMAAAVLAWAFPTKHPAIVGLTILFYGLFWWFLKNGSNKTDRLILPTLSLVLLFQFVLSLHFYPNLLTYQSTSQAGKMIRKENPSQIFWYGKHGHALDYYSGHIIPQLQTDHIKTITPGTWVYTTEERIVELGENRVIREFDDYPVTLLSLSFLNPQLRERKLKKVYLVEIGTALKLHEGNSQ